MKRLTLILLLTALVFSCEKELFQRIFTDPRDEHHYRWIQIGNQKWMAENLAYLPGVSPSNLGSYTDVYYYVNGYEGNSLTEAKQQTNYSIYGVLYNWAAATTACPVGWHLPSDEEWKVLEKHLGMNDLALDSIWSRDSGSVGLSLKANDTVYWLNADERKPSRRDFEAMGSGGRGVISGTETDCGGWFYGLRESTYFWSATITEPLLAWYRGLWYKDIGVYRYDTNRNYGFSVRCVKDEN